MASLNTKIVGGVVAVGLICAITAGAGIYTSVELSRGLDDSLRLASLERAQMRADLMHDALRADAIGAIQSTIMGSGFDIKQVAADYQEHARAFAENFANAKALAVNPQVKAALAAMDGPLEDYQESAKRIVDKAKTDAFGVQSEFSLFMKRFDALESAMDKASSTIEATMNAKAGAHVAFGRIAELLMIGLLILGATISVALAFISRRQVVRPLLDVTEVLGRLSQGDLSAKPSHADRKDEIGLMNKAVHAFREAVIQRQDELLAADQREALEAERARNEEISAEQKRVQTQVVTSIAAGLERLAHGDLTCRLDEEFPPAYEALRTDFNGALASLSEAIKGILATASSIRGGSGDISKAADELSSRTQQQAASVEETAATLGEITATVRKTADGADNAHTAVIEATEEVTTSSAVVGKAIDAMGAIEKSSTEISQIIGVIDEIAFQTNLLALNAGVEAARAGESGRGFAVVASEVRALAQRSAQAAKEIKSLISASTSQVSVGVDLVGQTGTALGRISDHVGRINGIVSEIASSARVQASGLGEINTSVDQMDRVIQQNAAMVEQTTAASHSLTDEAETLTRLMGRFRIVIANDPGAAALPQSGEIAMSTDVLRPKPRIVAAGGGVRELQMALEEEGWDEF